MELDNNFFNNLILSKMERAITVICILKIFFEGLTLILLLIRTIHCWRIKQRISDKNSQEYKMALFDYCKFGLCIPIIVTETLSFILMALGNFEYVSFESQANGFFHQIVSSNCSMFNSPQMVCAAYLGAFCLTLQALTIVALLCTIQFLNIMNTFLVNVIRKSQFNLNLIEKQAWWLFGESIFLIALNSIEFTFIIGVFLGYVIILYSFFRLCKGYREVYHALRWRAVDHLLLPRERAHFRRQAHTYKYTSIILCCIGAYLIISLSLFNIFVTGLFDFLFQPCWVNRIYSIQFQLPPIAYVVKGFLTNLFRFLARTALLFWLLLTTLLNLVVQVTIVVTYRKNLSKRYHLKVWALRYYHK